MYRENLQTELPGGKKLRLHCNFGFFWEKRAGCTAISAFSGKKAPVAATTVRVGEKMLCCRRRQAVLEKKTHCRRRRKCFLAKKRIVVADDRASWRKNALSSPTTGLPGEKTHRRRRRQAFLTKKRTVVADDRASRRKNALSSEGFPPQSVSFLGTFDYFCTEKRKYKSNIL